MGVAQYTWATSPLRRYVDLVNQWQIIACARHGRTAALAAPFKPKDAALFSVISGFDAAYARLQRLPARHRALLDAALAGAARRSRELDAAVMKDGLVRADTLPLVFRAARHREPAARRRVRARVGGIDLLTLDLHAVLAGAARRAQPPAPALPRRGGRRGRDRGQRAR